MKQNTTVTKALDSINKMMELSLEHQEIIGHHLFCAYAAGYDYGKEEGNKGRVGLFVKEECVRDCKSVTEAAEYLKVTKASIHKALLGTNKTCKGFVLKYI